MKKRIKNLLCLLMVSVMGLTACGTGGAASSDDVVLKIDDRNISGSEYMVYLYTATQNFQAAAGEDVWTMDFDGQTADELVEERTISTLQSVIAAEEYAKENKISLTKEQKQEAREAADSFLETVKKEDLEKMGIDAEGLYPLMEASRLFSLVQEDLSREFVVDAGETAAYYEENKDTLREDYTEITFDSILAEDREKAEEAAEKARNGEDFKALFEAYDIDPSQNEDGHSGEQTMYESYLRMGMGAESELAVGEITGPLELGGGYYILKILDKKVPAEEEVKHLAEEKYREQMQTQYASERLDEMIRTQTVEKVGEFWERTEKFH